LALACALVGDPDLLFLDEPTTGLDPQARRQLWALIEQFRATGRTTLLTTHYMDEAEYLCDRVAIMDHGKVIALGTPRELIARLGAEDVRTVRSSGDGYRMDVTELHRTVPALLATLARAGVEMSELRTRSATLED